MSWIANNPIVEESAGNLGLWNYLPLIFDSITTASTGTYGEFRGFCADAVTMGQGQFAGAGSLKAKLRIYGSMAAGATSATILIGYGTTITTIAGSVVTVNSTTPGWFESSEFTFVSGAEKQPLRLNIATNTGTLTINTGDLLVRGS